MTIARSINCYVIPIALFGSAMSISADQQADLTVAYEWSTGTVAPQFYEVRRITVRNIGDSDILVTKGTDSIGKTERKAVFAPDAVKLKALIDYIRSKHLDVPPTAAKGAQPSPRPGDGRCKLDFVVRDNAYSVPCNGRDASSLLNMIRDIVPASAS